MVLFCQALSIVLENLLWLKRRFVKISFIVCCAAVSMTYAQDETESVKKLSRAIAYVRTNEVEKALVEVGQDAFLKDLIQWVVLIKRMPFGTFPEMRHFAETHTFWPSQDLLRAGLEDAITIQTVLSKEDLRWFQRYPPQQGTTALMCLTQIKDTVPEEEFKKYLRSLWRRTAFSAEEEKWILFSYKKFLSHQDMIDRANILLWKRQTTAAARLLPFIPATHLPLMKARIQLGKGHPRKTKCPEALVKKFGKDFCFAYTVVFIERKKGKFRHAPSLLKKIDFFKDTEHMSLWGQEVQYVARELIRTKRFQEAYQILARAAFPVKECEYADAQFLAGWVALRRLKQPKVALQHFSAIEKHSQNHRYQAHALYWKARALEQLKRRKEARSTLSRCAAYENTFWGQLARETLGKKMQLSVEKKSTSSKLKNSTEVATLLRAARLFTLAQEDVLAGYFAVCAGQRIKTAEDAIYLLHEAAKISPHVGIHMYTMYACKKIHTPWVTLYPDFPLQKILNVPLPVDEVLALSVIRVESAFSRNALSCSGAMGYMQLMSYTAREVAKRHAFPSPSIQKLFTERYNILLGTTHLRELLDLFKNYPFAIAAYNAGSTAVNRWTANGLDPRTKTMDIIDWIELIPYRETRIYVQKVLLDMQVYAHLLNKQGFDLLTLLKKKRS
ncbi:MAG: lytic transglycosylase domain-containing protein [Holosporales bacterium]|jgi:soluble lytic murein transglycosylase|nr:lytic transglycosylase domain-containing protein [Holosporales bacterium]